MRAGLEALRWETLAPGLQVHVSVGVSTTGEGVSLQDLVRVADAAMYTSKNEAADGATAAVPQNHHGVPVDGTLAG